MYHKGCQMLIYYLVMVLWQRLHSFMYLTTAPITKLNDILFHKCVHQYVSITRWIEINRRRRKSIAFAQLKLNEKPLACAQSRGASVNITIKIHSSQRWYCRGGVAKWFCFLYFVFWALNTDDYGQIITEARWIMNIVQFLIFYALTLIIVNFWIRIIISILEMAVSKDEKDRKIYNSMYSWGFCTNSVSVDGEKMPSLQLD